MKTLFLIAFAFLSLQDLDVVSYKADCINMTDEGIITLNIWDIKKGKKYKIEQAERDAVQYVLYEGFRNKSCGYVSPLLKSYELKHEFEDSHMYFFRNNGGYSKYIIESKISETKPIGVKEGWQVYHVVVNKKLFDEYLVEKGIKSKIDIY